MNDPLLLLPLFIIFTGALIAAFSGLPALNRRLSIIQLSWLLALAPLTAFLVLLQYIPDLQANLAFTWPVAWMPSLGLNVGLYYDSFRNITI